MWQYYREGKKGILKARQILRLGFAGSVFIEPVNGLMDGTGKFNLSSASTSTGLRLKYLFPYT
jgi:hypothetical protein